MTRATRILGALLAVALAAAIGSSAAQAAPVANSTCHPFTLNGHKIHWEVIGTWTCTTAKRWVVKLDKDKVKPQLGNVALHNGPARYHCYATSESSKGLVVDGTCYLGTLAFPKSGFAW